MKTVCKKLLSVMLVAMLLVSAIPFQASADGTDFGGIDDSALNTSTSSNVSTTGEVEVAPVPAYNSGLAANSDEETNTVEPITLVVKVDGNVVIDNVAVTPSNGQSAKVANLLTYYFDKTWSNSYDFARAYNSNTKADMGLNDWVLAGQKVYIAVTTKSTSSSTEETTEPTTTTTTTNKFPYKAYLHIYLNNKVDVPSKTLDITEGIAIDGVVSKSEVENVVRNYYNAQNSKGIVYDGLYLAKGNWVSNFAQDLAKYDQITGILEARQNYEVHINVMITNAVAKTTTTTTSSGVADTTNPKTGDTILGTVAALGLSVSALAALYYVTNKKRFF